MNAEQAVAEIQKALPWLDQAAFPIIAPDALRVVLDRLAEHERTQATGGPPPPETRGWANEAIVPAPETAHDQSMAVPDRYQRSDAHLRDRREDTT